MFVLGVTHEFPPVAMSSPQGVIAVGGDLHPNRLLKAYQEGIFPWYNDGEPIIWHCPDPRMVLRPQEVYISKSMRKVLRNNTFKVTFNQNFPEVITHCKHVYREGQWGTWITDELHDAMLQLHKMGYAKSVEVWQDGKLVGGLYGMDLGNVFTGDSMFSLVSNASKVAFIHLCQKLEQENYDLLDCQVYNEHLASLGAYEIPRTEFLKYLS
jgi:leucyl/phenylalanyl-tRNA--protein transferase